MRRFVALCWLFGCAGEDLDRDGVPANRDCNDADPHQTEPEELHVDEDGDGYAGDGVEVGCLGSVWLFEDATDCADDDPTVHPGVVEIGCDGLDNDCDPATGDGPAFTVGATWTSIQDAVDAAGFNETVEICASTVQEDVTISRPITLAGAGAGVTILEGTGNGPVVHIASDLGGLTTLVDLSIEGGTGLDVEGTRVGGGVLISSSLAVLNRVEILHNEADDGGGLAVLDDAAVIVTGSSIHDNTATNRGGALFSDGATSLEITLSDLTANTALVGGGWWARGIVTLDQTTVSGNHASWGGGLALDEQPPFETQAGTLEESSNTQIIGLTGALVTGNSALLGGGVYGSGNLSGVVVDANDANEGGGVYATGPLVVFESTISGNHALTGSGGGISLPPEGSFVASGLNVLSNTAAGAGGGLYANGATFVLVDVDLEENVAEDGGGIAVVGTCDACTLEGTNVDFAFNVAESLGGDVVMAQPQSTLHLTGSQLLGSTALRGGSVAVLSGVVDVEDVHMIDAAATDADSAAVEVGDTGSTFRVTGGEFVGNDPTDVRVLPLPAQIAPAESFVCSSATGCVADP